MPNDQTVQQHIVQPSGALNKYELKWKWKSQLPIG